MIKSLNKNIIYDFNDALYARDSFSKKLSAIGNGSPKTVRRLKYVLRSAKTVIAGNEHLAKFATKFNNNVRVVPTTVKFSDYDYQRKNDKEVITIGWIGQSNNQVYLEELQKVFIEISTNSPKVILKVISDKPYETKGINIVNIKWDINDYKSHLYQMDIGIMPLKDDEWSKGKCAIKIIQYMAAGLPVIASDVGLMLLLLQTQRMGIW